ncbi:hypothetical protein CTZ27_09920 [Streptomyces griseocarneus]|nr:hypothetical protein CTZ27_09920 [Streptomyces griseocarneus]
MSQHPDLEVAIRYHEAVARGATGEELASFFHEEAVQQEFPDILFPDGVRRDLPAVLRAAERGRTRPGRFEGALGEPLVVDGAGRP